MSEHDEPKTALTRLVGEHPRGDWSDGTHSCQGCADRVLQELEAALASMGEGVTQDEIRAGRRRYNAASHPGWTREEYAAHLADVLLAEGYATSPAPEATETVEWGVRWSPEHDITPDQFPTRALRAHRQPTTARAYTRTRTTYADRVTEWAPVDRAVDEHEEDS